MPDADALATARAEIPFLEGGGEVGALMRAHDWSATPLGPPETWPQSLRSAVSIMLPSKSQIAMFWGPDLITLYNDEYRPALGRKHPWALGAPVRDVWNELWDIGLADVFLGVLNTGQPFWAKEYLFILERHGQPEETYLDVTYDPIRDESGGVGGIFCIVSETTGRVFGDRRIKTLRDVAARYPDARTDEEVCRLSVDALRDNPNDVPFALIYLTRSPDAPPRLVAQSAGTEDLASADLWPWRDAIASNAIVQAQLPPRATDPAVTHPPVAAAVVPIGGGSQTGVVGFMVAGLSPIQIFNEDYRGFLELFARQVASGIANALAYEQERQRAETLAQLDRAKTAFFSNVSHEFRTPLTLMLGPLEDTLAQSSALGDADRERLTVAHRNSLRLLKLVNTLLDFSRIEAGRSEASYAPTDLAALTSDLASMFRSAIERAGLRFDVQVDALNEPAYVDREMWEKVVLNLLSNAFKFTLEGEIAVRLQRDGDHVVLTVRDTGSGIPADEMPHLFERFHRVRGARGRTFEGSGIGLALVQELVKLHGGSVHARSEEDRGSEFSVRLPLGAAHLPADRIGAPRTLSSTATGGAPYIQELLGWLPNEISSDDEIWGTAGAPTTTMPARILVADDNADMREYVSRLLAGRYDVEVVSDGVEALAAIRKNPPDLILTDIMMPELDGFGLLQAVRSDETLRRIPVIMLSARAGEEARVEGLHAGADDYLVKPFSARELLVRIAGRLELSRLRSHLQREREELAELFMQTPVPTALLSGPDLVFEAVNPAYQAVLRGRTLVGRPVLEALPELAGQGYDDQLRTVMRTGQPLVAHDSLVKLERDGQVHDTYWTYVYAPLRDADGAANKVIVICNEVTAEVTSRDAIARSEARYRSIFEGAGVSIWEEDFAEVKAALEQLRADGVRDLRAYLKQHPEFLERAVQLIKVIDVNAATLKIFGARNKGELLDALPRLFIPDTEETLIGELEAIWEGRSLYEAETALRTLSGERLDFLFTIAFSEADPQLRSVLVTLADITERKRAERALREDTRTLETLNSVGRALNAELDLERIVQAVTDAGTALSGAAFGAFFYNVRNEAGESYLLYTLSGAPREAFSKFGTPRNTAVFSATFSGAGIVRVDDITSDARYGKNAPHYGMPKGHLPVRSYLAVPVISRTGDVIGGLFFGHPEVGVFTARAEQLVAGLASQAAVAIDNARLYEQRLHLISQLQEADRRKDEFLATLSHELRNPLAPLRNSLHLLRLAGNGSGSAAPIHEMMDRQVNHLVRLVDDLLEMSRISRGTFELRRERMELSTIVRSALETSDPLIQAAGHKLSVDLPNERIWIDGDPMRLGQVLANLLNNAAKYTDPGGEIALRATREGNAVTIAVRDNGAGISAEALPRLFEMFSRGDRSSGRDHGGLGIGLALARRLVEMHGGSIMARSEGLGRGSEFIVRIPLAVDQSSRSPTPERAGAVIPRRRILVVDDNRDAAESLSLLLEFLGGDVRVAFDGPEALRMLQTYEPDLVLLDIGLPEMDGYEVARRMRDEFPDRHTSIVALTGWGQDEDRRRARDAGFDRHLIKPADVAALQALLNSLGGRAPE